MISALSKISGFLFLFACDAFSSSPAPKIFVSTVSNSRSMSTSTQHASAVSNWRVLHKTATVDEISGILSLHPDWARDQYNAALELYDKLMDCDDAYVAPLIKEALNVLDHAYRLYGPESVICSYNGGKDAVVILHLVRAAHAHHYRHKNDDQVIPIRPRAVYFDHPDEFTEILALLDENSREYDLDMLAFEKGIKFGEGLQTLVNHNIPSGGSNVAFPLAFVLGTRSTDPNAGAQGQFAPSSHYMPPFMRVNPVLSWTYGHVWHFLRLYHLPYCTLYDQGYTSLGTTKDTFPCPALAVAGVTINRSNNVPKYWPAYMLRDWDQERAGRASKDKINTGQSTPTQKAPPLNVLIKSPSQKSLLSTFTDLGAASESDMPRNDPVAKMKQNTASDDDNGYESVVSFESDGDIQRTVGLLIIGDEILKGIISDTNTQTAARALYEQNVILSKVVVCSDDQEEIVAEIKRLQRDVDVIITSGGVGPTHDDVTIKSVAAALDKELGLHEEMAQLLKDKMNKIGSDELTEAQVKMATLPSNSKLRYLSDNKLDWPILQCRNIFILPGVPQFFETKITSLAVYLSSQLERSITYKVVLSVDEASIVEALNQVVSRHPMVSFGSYPFMDHPAVKTVVTLEGIMIKGGLTRNSVVYLERQSLMKGIHSKEQMDYNVQVALDDLINALPKDSILRVDNNDGLLFF